MVIMLGLITHITLLTKYAKKLNKKEKEMVNVDLLGSLLQPCMRKGL